MNRHYLKALAPARLLEESLPFLVRRVSSQGSWGPTGATWLEATLRQRGIGGSAEPAADRLHTVFSFDAAATLADPAMRQRGDRAGSRARRARTGVRARRTAAL